MRALILFFSLIIFSCETITREDKISFTDTINVNDNRKSSYQSDSNWNCIEVQHDNICYPKEWIIVNQSDYLFFSVMGDSDKVTNFVVSRFDTLTSGNSIIPYIRDGYQTLSTDKSNSLVNTDFYHLLYDDGSTAYSGRFFMKIDNKYYTSFGAFTEINGMLYDFSLQYPTEDSNKYQPIVEKILNSYKANESHVFGNKKISQITKIDLSKI